MDSHIVNIILAVISSGSLAALFTHWNNKRKSNRVDFELILKTLSDENRELKLREAHHTKRLNELDRQVLILQNKILLLESAHMSAPVPMWLKDPSGVMLAINQAYTKYFNKTPDEYIGNDDIEVWGEKMGAQYKKHDEYVSLTGHTFDGVEDVLIDGELVKMRVIKWPRKIGNTIVGIAGIAIPPMNK